MRSIDYLEKYNYEKAKVPHEHLSFKQPNQ